MPHDCTDQLTVCPWEPPISSIPNRFLEYIRIRLQRKIVTLVLDFRNARSQSDLNNTISMASCSGFVDNEKRVTNKPLEMIREGLSNVDKYLQVRFHR